MDMLIAVLTQWRRLNLSRQAGAVRQAVQAMTPDQRKAWIEANPPQPRR